MKDPGSQRFIDAESHLEASFELAMNIFRDGFRPSFVVGLWRGGSTVGIAVQECLEYLGIATDHIALRTSYAGRSSYADQASGKAAIRVHGMQYLVDTLNAEDQLLLVDDVYSTGRSIAAVRARLAQRLKRNLPADIRTAAVWYRPSTAAANPAPDYFLEQTNDWLVLPYELSGIDPEEIRRHKPGLGGFLDRIEAAARSHREEP